MVTTSQTMATLPHSWVDYDNCDSWFVNHSLVFCSQMEMTHLEMLMQREQLMEDIDGICDEFFCEHFPNSKEQFDDLVRVLCDAVCKNFPTN